MASEDISQASITSRTFPNPSIIQFKAENYHQHFTTRLLSYRERETFTDVVLKCKDFEIPCHRVVLAAASSYFHQMFAGGRKEAKSDVVELTTFSPDILGTIVDFIYTAEVTITTDNVQSLCSACDELDLVELKEGCDQFMSQRIEPFNCLGLSVFAKKYDLNLTLEKSKHCMNRKLHAILRLALDHEFKAMEKSHLIDYISRDDLDIADEAMVFQLVEKWVGVDPKNREDSVSHIMEHVRLALCTPEYLCNVVEKSPIMQSKECLLLLLEAKTYQLLPAQRQSIASARTKLRKCPERVVLIDGDNSAGGKCWYLEEQRREWKEFTTLPVPQWKYCKACLCGTDLILTGGEINCSDTNHSWCLSLNNKVWKELPSMNDCRRAHAAASVEGEVYVMGGYANGVISRVEKLDVKRERWTRLAPMKRELRYHLAVHTDHGLFVLAGRDKSYGASLTTQKYDMMSDQWKLKADMPQPCLYGSAVYLNENIYVVGDDTRCCMSYDPRQDAWTTHAQPMQKRNDPAAIVWKGKIFLCGGCGRNDVEEYDVNTDKWTALSELLPNALQYHSMLTVNTPVD